MTPADLPEGIGAGSGQLATLEQSWLLGSRLRRISTSVRSGNRPAGMGTGAGYATVVGRERVMPEARSGKYAGKEWASGEVNQLRELAESNTPVGVMSIRLGRSEDAIRSKAHAEGISLQPPNRRPYGDMSWPARCAWIRDAWVLRAHRRLTAFHPLGGTYACHGDRPGDHSSITPATFAARPTRARAPDSHATGTSRAARADGAASAADRTHARLTRAPCTGTR